MLVYVTLKAEEAGKVLFNGDLEACQDYASGLNDAEKANFYDLHICEDNGVIFERIITPQHA